MPNAKGPNANAPNAPNANAPNAQGRNIAALTKHQAIEIARKARIAVVRELVREHGISLTPEAREEWIDVYWRTLGRFIFATAIANPGIDLWDDPKLFMLKEYILKDAVEKLAEELELGNTRARSIPVDPEELNAAVDKVFSEKNLRIRCGHMIDDFNEALPAAVRTPICPQG